MASRPLVSKVRAGRGRGPIFACVIVAAVGLAGCGDDADGPASTSSQGPGTATVAPTSSTGGVPSSTSPGPTTTGRAPATPSFTALANAVCRVEVADVPPVPDPSATVGEGRRYVVAVGRAARGLTSALVQLEGRRPGSQRTLDPLVRRARTVAGAARAASSKDGERAADVQDDVRIAIARLNETSSAAGLPGCAL